MSKTKILILGGTNEANKLANTISNTFSNVDVITSLAGQTKKPREIHGKVRVGGFGGANGLSDYIKSENIKLVVDMTHPFAEKISHNALTACRISQTERMVFSRPKWELPQGAKWQSVNNMSEAANSIQQKFKKVFITTGNKNLHVFEGFKNTWFLIRLIEKPSSPIKIKNFELILDRPPYNSQKERSLLIKNEIDCIISKNSGGTLTKPKIDVALELKIPIILIKRPPQTPGPYFQKNSQCIEFLNQKYPAIGFLAEKCDDD